MNPNPEPFVKLPIGILTLLAAAAAHAGPRSSANYTLTTESTDAGGARTKSTSYTNDGSAGGVAGLSAAPVATTTAKAGYTGQLYEITGLTLAASGADTVNEGGTLQFSARQALGDATFLAVDPGSVAWSVQSGPLAGIDTNGMATADVVYQNTAATAQGDLGGFTGLFHLTVLDRILDNFGSYAGDGLGDDWQVQHFGLDNPNAAPDVRTDGTGLTNLFKYTARLIPNDASSDFTVDVNPVPGEPTHKVITFGPAYPDRGYSIRYSTGLGDWFPLSPPSAGNGGTVIFTDTAAGGPQKFYQVQITNP